MPPQTIHQERAWLLREKYAGNETPEFFIDLKRLEAGEPLAYIIGHIPFLDATIDLSHRPLIPRVETEYWVGEAIKLLMRRGLRPRRILDLFAGSGCIGIALAQAFPQTAISFGEHNPDLIAQIKKNITLNNIDATRVTVVETNVFSHITEVYDAIFANPPYIPLSHKETVVEKSVRAFEPAQALYGGEDGLQYIKSFIAEAPNHLITGGILFVEFNTDQKNAIESLAKQNAQYRTVEFIKDQYELWRTAILVKS